MATFFNRQITDKCECLWSHTATDKTRYVDFRICIYLSFSLKQTRRCIKLEIEHKSLILAQIERWRHALHMQVGRQRGVLALCRRVANG